MSYAAPTLTEVGSVRDLTLGFNWSLEQDEIFGHSIPVGGDKPNPGGGGGIS